MRRLLRTALLRRALRLLLPAMLLVPTLALLPTPSAGGHAGAGHGTSEAVRPARPLPPSDRRAAHSPGVRTLLQRGYLVPDEAAYAAAKSRAAARVRTGDTAASAESAADGPQELVTWQGPFDPRGTPSDSTGAIGRLRYVELINTKFAIYRRDGRRLSRGDLSSFTGLGRNALLTDPQIIWDHETNRFYYVVLDVDFNGFDYAYGFSRTAAPRGPGDWCKFTLSYGYDDPERGTFRLPDFPHMGDTRNFILFGANVFDITFEQSFVGADVQWITKPPPAPGCPSGSTFRTGLEADLRMPSGQKAFTPIVANQIDSSTDGWIVSARFNPSGPSRTIALFRIRKGATRRPIIQHQGVGVDVPAYSMPPSAPQRGTFAELDTLDARFLQAVAAVDPARGGVAVWTQHAIEGGAGSMVRWYEINVDRRRLFQTGDVEDSELFAYNGAVSPDRILRDGVRKFGRSMVLGFNTSSEQTFPAIRMVSKVGNEAQSGFVLVKASPGPERDFSCQPVCRWGDYSGATPDPGANPDFEVGRVWLTNMWSLPPGPRTMDWRTWNWAAKP